MELKEEVLLDVSPYARVLKDGTIERLAGTKVSPAGLDPQTGVLSKDIVIFPQTGVSARLYRPENITGTGEKLPLIVYYHGGAFCIASAAEPLYHNCLNMLVAEARAIAVSVNYRLAPEEPLPIAYEDSWEVLQWVFGGEDRDCWVKDHVDFERVFLVGDSAGANITHHLALRVKKSDPDPKLKISGIGLIHPYFWGKVPIGREVTDTFRKSMVDTWWSFVCPSEKEGDDPLINPFLDGAPSLEGLGCGKVLVLVAGNDILRDRGRLYYDELVKSNRVGSKEFVETEGEDHVFHIFNPNSEKAESMIKHLGSFINQNCANSMGAVERR